MKYICQCGYESKIKSSYYHHKIRCGIYQKYLSSILTKEFLEKHLIQNNFSANYISTKIINNICPAGTIIKYAKKFGIKTHSILEANNALHKQELTKKTNREKYGVENTFQSPATQITLQRKYGKNITNIFQVKEIKDKIFDDERWMNKYGMSRKEYLKLKSTQAWEKITDEEKNIWLMKSLFSSKSIKNYIKKGGYNKSKLESRIEKILIKNRIPYLAQFYIKIKEKRKGKLYDFLILDKIILEIQGDYWHANPDLYDEHDNIHYIYGTITAKDIWERDKEKEKIAIKKGYLVFYLWEKDIKNMNDKELKTKILNLIGEKNDFKN